MNSKEANPLSIQEALSWDETQTLEWIITNVAKNLSKESQNKFIENKITLLRLHKVDDNYLQNTLLVESKLSRSNILKKSETLYNDTIKNQLIIMNSISFREWNHQQLIIWFQNLLENKLSQESKDSLSDYQLLGQDLDDLDHDILDEQFQFKDKQVRDLIISSINSMKEKGKQQPQKDSTQTQQHQQFDLKNTMSESPQPNPEKKQEKKQVENIKEVGGKGKTDIEKSDKKTDTNLSNQQNSNRQDLHYQSQDQQQNNQNKQVVDKKNLQKDSKDNLKNQDSDKPQKSNINQDPKLIKGKSDQQEETKKQSKEIKEQNQKQLSTNTDIYHNNQWESEELVKDNREEKKKGQKGPQAREDKKNQMNDGGKDEKVMMNEIQAIKPKENFINEINQLPFLKQMAATGKDEEVFTFFCYFQEFKENDKLSLTFSTKSTKYLVMSSYHSKNQFEMNRIPFSKIFYIQLKMKKETTYYHYSFERTYSKSYVYQTKMIDRSQDSLEKINYIIFDTPDEFGHFRDYSSQTLKQYILLYVNNITELETSFLKSIIKFIQEVIYDNYARRRILELNEGDLENIPSYKVILYQGILQYCYVERDYQLKCQYYLPIRSVQLDIDTFLSLPVPLQENYIQGLQTCVQIQQMPEALSIPTEIKKRLPNEFWKFQFLYSPREDIMRQINFEGLGETIRNKFFGQLINCKDISYSQIFNLIQLIQPSFDLQISSIKFALSYYIQNKDLAEYYLTQQNKLYKEQLLYDKEIRENLLSREETIKDSLELFMEQNLKQIEFGRKSLNLSQEDYNIILLDLINALQKHHLKDLFLNSFTNLIKLLDSVIYFQIVRNQESSVPIKLLKSFKDLILGEKENCYEQILQLDFELKNENLIKFMIQMIEVLLKNMKLCFMGASLQLDKIQQCNFVKKLTQRHKNSLIINIFDMICEQQQLQTISKIKLIDEQYFIKMLTILFNNNLLQESKFSNDLVIFACCIYDDISTQKIKMSNLRELLYVKADLLEKIVGFCEIKYDRDAFEQVKKQLIHHDNIIKDLTVLASLMKDFQIQGYENLNKLINETLNNGEITLEEFNQNMKNVPKYECTDNLFVLNEIPFVNKYTHQHLTYLKQQNQLSDNDAEFSDQILEIRNQIRTHLEALNKYEENNNLQFKEIIDFWQFMIQEQNEYDENDIFSQTNQALKLLFEDPINQIEENNKIIFSHIVYYQLFFKDKDLVYQLHTTSQLLNFEQIEAFKEKYNKLTQLVQDIKDLEEPAKEINQTFSNFINQTGLTIKEIIRVVPKQIKQQLITLINELKNKKELIKYLNKLDNERINLEDLVDVIDDTSMETDVLVQEMMGVRNALQFIRFGEEDQPDIATCLVERYQKFDVNIQKNQNLQKIITRCVDNLEMIMMKIYNQSDRSAKTLQIVKNLQQNIQIKIQRQSGESVSVVTFCTEFFLSQQKHVQELNQEELNLLCNRFKLIKSNKKKDVKQEEVLNQDLINNEEQERDISTKLTEVLDLSEEIRQVLDNLMNLGHKQFADNYSTKPNSLDNTILLLKENLETFKVIDEENIKLLEQVREQYMSLNFFPPYTFQLIEKYAQQHNNVNESKKILDELYRLAKNINEHQQPKIKEFQSFIQEKASTGQLLGLHIYGEALDILLQLPEVEVIQDIQHKCEKYTKGLQIECRRIKSSDLLLKSIMTFFLAHNQKPNSWQIFFCSPKTQLHDLEQFAQLAKNTIKCEKYRNQAPLFLICQFDNLSLHTQRLFIDRLEEMYQQLNIPINLLITYIGNIDTQNSMHILQQFKYAFEPDYHYKDSELIKYLQIDCFKTITIHKSKYSGFGKTYQINKRSITSRQQLIEIPLYGETTKQQLIDLIGKKIQNITNKEEGSYRIHLNIYDSKSDEIHSILFQLLVLRRLSISTSQFIQIPSHVWIEIEVQNTFMDTLESKIKYLEQFLLPENTFLYGLTKIQINSNNINKQIQGAEIDKFDILNNPNFEASDLQTALQYLKNFQNIQNYEVKDVKSNPVSQQEAINLIKQYFLNRVENNFSFFHVTNILKFFTKQALLFHKAVYLEIEMLNDQGINKSLRKDVFQGIIDTCVPKSCQIMSNNYQEQDNQEVQQDYFKELNNRNNNIKGWDDTTGQSGDFFLTISQSGTLVPIFQNLNSVPQYYTSYCNSQFIKDPVKDWSTFKSNEIRDKVLINLCTPARNENEVKKYIDQNYNHIAITKTIARKICFLYIKIFSDIPTLIMGETGVGKTILVKYLSSLIGGVIFILNVHAGITQKEIINWVDHLITLNNQSKEQLENYQKIQKEQILKEPENEQFQQDLESTQIFLNLQNQNSHRKEDSNETKIILFFDEINTNQNIDGILKELLIDRKMLGEPLPKNFVPIAAANPYKFKTANDQEENTDSLKITGCESAQTSKLIYHVYPFAESMNTFIWHFGELLQEDEYQIVQQMILNTSDKCEKMVGYEQTLLSTITTCQQFSRNKQSVRSVSLRDVSRFLRVYQHFLADPAWEKNISEALLLSVFYSYYCRFNTLAIREELCQYLDGQVNNQGIRFTGSVKEIVNKEMEKIQDIINQGESYKSIAFTTTLKENLFMTLISVLNQIPIIMVGPPGSSKTLCTRLLYNSMKGSQSKIEFFKNLPNLMYKTYQCSILSTSESIEKAFNSAKQLAHNIKKTQNDQQEHQKNIVTLLLDEVGLAEASKTNPLKVLHRILEDQSNVPMIGLSNWSLDASKMNRVVFANRPKLSENELVEAAIAIQQRISPDIDSTIIMNLAKDSFSYFSKSIQKTFFHGTRDYYNCVTYVCSQLNLNKDNLSEELIQQILLVGVLRNFGGTKENKDILHYFKLSITEEIESLYENNMDQYNPTQLINMNIKDRNCRNLMIISNKPDHVLQYTERLCKERQYKIFQGSDLLDEFAEYNSLKMLNEIITCMEEGYLVIMYSLENLYQSFYDLFNQNYVELGAQKFCRIAIGSDSIRSRVHQDFKVIIIAQSKDVYESGQNYDPPLLNRFEKQYLDLKYVLDHNELQIQEQIFQFVSKTSQVKSDGLQLPKSHKKWEFNVQDMFPIMQEKNKEDMIFSLTLKHNNINDQKSRIEKSILELLDLSTTSGLIRSNFLKKLDKKYLNYILNQKYRCDFDQLLLHLDHAFKEKHNKDIEEEIQLDDEDNDDDDDDVFERCAAKNQINEQNIILYTPEFNHTPTKHKAKSYVEVELRWVNANSLKQQVKSFFSNNEFVNFILIASIQDSYPRILHAKRILEEERQIFEQSQQQKYSQQKNFIIVIQTINQNNNFTGLSFDKQWRQIYIENTQSMIQQSDDLSHYLKPLKDVLQNDQNGIYQMIIQQCLPKLLLSLNFDGEELSEQDLKDRLKVYKEFLSNQHISEKLTKFIKTKIQEQIQVECEVYNKIKMPCEWYQLVSIKNKENRINNKFISSLKQYLLEQSLPVLIKLFYQAEKNNIISSIMQGKIEGMLNKENMNIIVDLLQSEFNQSQGDERNCDQSKITYPFFTMVKSSYEEFKQDILNKLQQIEEIKQLNRKSNNSNNQDILIHSKVPEFNLLDIDQQLSKLTQFIDPSIKKISEIDPQLYFNNLHHDNEYQYTENKTLKKIVEKMISVLFKKASVESYHSLIWINEKIFVQLSQVWRLAEDYSCKESKRVYEKFEKNLEKLLLDLQNEKVEDEQEPHEENKDDIEEDVKLSQLEKIWSEILIFTIKICEVFILPMPVQDIQEGEKDDWISNLKKSLGIIFTYYSESELDLSEMLQYMSKYNFVLRISECFSKNNQSVRSFIKEEMYDQNDEFQFISGDNFIQIKNVFTKHCDDDKQDELTLRLIWQLLKSDDLNEDFGELDTDIIQSIIESLQHILNKLDYTGVKNNQDNSHYYIFSKRILQQIITKMYEDFDDNFDEQIEDLLDPTSNESFKKMHKIFENLKIQLDEPICTLVIDIISECKYYSSERILSFIAQHQDNQDNVEIDESRIKQIVKLLVNKENNNDKGVLIHIIELKILQDICLTICQFVYENYLFNKRQTYNEELQQTIKENYESDRIRKNRMIQLLNQSLLQILSQNEINPLTPIVVVKIFKKQYNIDDLTCLTDIIDVFKNNIFHSNSDQNNVSDFKLQTLKIALNDDLKTHKKLQSVQEFVNAEITNNKPQLQFYLTNIISELVLSQDQPEFNETIKLLDQLNPKIIDIELLIEIYAMFTQMFDKIKDQSLPLIKVFILNLISSSFLDSNTFIKKLYQEQISIENIFIPFMNDSDSMLMVKEQLKDTTAIRRYQCTNCINLQYKKTGMWIVLPCCMPSQAQKCDVCKKMPVLQDHFSVDMMPPILKSNKQEPVFVKERADYPDYSCYYNRPGFPYTGEVQRIDDFIKNRGRVDQGYQYLFSIINSSKGMRELTQIDDILFGRVFMLSILCFYCHLIVKSKGKEMANNLLNFSNPIDIFYSKDQEYDIAYAWKILKQKYQNNDNNIMNYFNFNLIKNMLFRQADQNSEFYIDLSQDENRIKFENQFTQFVLETKNLSGLNQFSEKLKDQSQIVKYIILDGKLNLVTGKYESLRQFKNLCRINFSQKNFNRNGFENFQNYIITKPDSKESEFFKINIDYKNQTFIYSQIYFIQNWIKIFNAINFDNITLKQAAETKLSQYIEDHKLKSEFEEFRSAWMFFKEQIDTDKIQIGVDCALILLDDINNENQKIDIFCYSEDKASRGYPLYLLFQYFKVSHNNYLDMLSREFSSLINKFSEKKMILMNKKNFLSPNISFFPLKNQEDFFENQVEKFSGKNPLAEHEEEDIYDLRELTSEYIEDYFQGLTKIQEPSSKELERIQLKNFRFKGNYKAVNFIREIPDKIEQILYPEIQNNKLQPFLSIDLQNSETSMKLLEVLKVAMSIILKVNSNQKFSGDINLVEFLSGFGIQEEGINFTKEKFKLCHLQHVYELAERRCFEILIENVNAEFLVELTIKQKELLEEFCKQVSLFDLEVFHEALGRILARVLCDQNVPLNPKFELFQLFIYSSDDFEYFWGIENKAQFQKLIDELQWNEKYPIFEMDNEYSITFGQTFKLYKEIQINNHKRLEEENQKNKVIMNKQQADQKKIEEELIGNGQFMAAAQQEKKKKIKKQKNDYR